MPNLFWTKKGVNERHPVKSKRQTAERGKCQKEGSNTDFPHGTLSDSSWTSDGFHLANKGTILTHPMNRATIMVLTRKQVVSELQVTPVRLQTDGNHTADRKKEHGRSHCQWVFKAVVV